MSIELNHTIVHVKDRWVASRDVAQVLGLPVPTAYGPFAELRMDNGASLDVWTARARSTVSTTPSSWVRRTSTSSSVACMTVTAGGSDVRAVHQRGPSGRRGHSGGCPRHRRSRSIDTRHLLVVLLEERGSAYHALREAGADVEVVAQKPRAD